MIDSSHRERAKARRKKAIEFAAMRLFAAQGYDKTTVADIASAAEVAPRTVSLHFPTKLDIALASTNEAMSRLLVVLIDSDRDVADTVVDWLESEVMLIDAEERALRAAMFRANPALRALTTIQGEEVARVGIQVLSSDLGVPTGAPIVRTALGAIVGAVQETELAGEESLVSESTFEGLRSFLKAGLSALRKETGR